jgi:flagellar biosynthesis/type III secretory pathway M-ring protein FliF/YscJ
MDEAFLNWITPRDLELGPNGVVGEEPNTENPDPPIYPNEADDTLTNQDASDYTKKLHWLFGEHVTQIERSRGVVQDASVSVIVKSEIVRLTPAERAEYEALVANATNINPDSISFRNQYVAPDPGPLPPNPTFLDIFLQWLPYMLMGLFLLVVVAVVIIKIIADQNRKKALAIEMQNNEKVRALEAELFEKNRSLAEQASEQNREKENVAQQIKDFVTQNPEIAAGLIRSMIKGEE